MEIVENGNCGKWKLWKMENVENGNREKQKLGKMGIGEWKFLKMEIVRDLFESC